ncbi:type III secretion system inner membrane ring lipoprotein SctJ [Aquabacterium sp.]|uniref:type III secretion system inner membrane ring lipoprotein SctJ n=1 Tax=Aquabacterium sp. TaxID=1872578 RepID=UPI002C3931F4|nr:type III secretion inner membrane ring lipoprotein SctJ [Aquabacterium sp.]HSW06935.1 type III secretion inner membrane ring lipoprotein SctJ [Aquabacterium sp.]
MSDPRRHNAGRARVALLFAALLVLLAACSGRVDLVASVAEAEANEALAALLAANVQAEKVPGKEGMVGIRVAQGQVAQAVDVLKARGLPRERHAGMGEVFRKEGLISSPLEERARYVFALSQELSGTLSRLDGVLVARVHVVLPERSPAGEETTPSSAAVFIKHQPDANLDTVQPQIRRLVSHAIPGLTGDRVSLVLVPAAAEPQAAAPVAAAAERGDMWRTAALLLGVLAVLLLAGLGALAWQQGLLRRLLRTPAA